MSRRKARKLARGQKDSWIFKTQQILLQIILEYLRLAGSIALYRISFLGCLIFFILLVRLIIWWYVPEPRRRDDQDDTSPAGPEAVQRQNDDEDEDNDDGDEFADY